MAILLNILEIPLDGTGTEIPVLDVVDGYTEYWITGSATATGNYGLVTTGTPKFGLKFVFRYRAVLDITSGSKTFSIFGQSFTQNQLNSKLNIICTYTTGWLVEIEPSFTSAIVEGFNIVAGAVDGSDIAAGSIGTSQLATNSVTTLKVTDANITNSKIANLAVTDSKVNDVNGSKIANTSIDGSIKLIDSSVPNSKLANLTASSLKFGNSSGIPGDLVLGNNQMAIGNGSTITTISRSTLTSGAGLFETIVIPVSLNTGEQALNSIFTQYNGTIVQISLSVNKALAGTDNATIAVYINSTPITGGSITLPASTTINTIASTSPSGANTISSIGSQIDIQGSKTTGGGHVIVSLIILRT